MREDVSMDEIQKTLLMQVADLHEVPAGAYNIRSNGEAAGRRSTEHIEIVPKEDKPGIDIFIKPGTKKESVHIPVLMTQTGLKELVYNDFHIGEDCDVTIVAGCGIHNGGDQASEHSGIHSFFIGKNARVRYVEKHYGFGEGTGERVMNPQTIVSMEEDSYLEMDTVQIRGVDSTDRVTRANLGKGAQLVIREKLMTHGKQKATTHFYVDLDGEDSSTNVISRSVAKDSSEQTFYSHINGNNKCAGHSECDAIIMDNAVVRAIPEITANNIDASLIHEAAIGKIAGEQLIKLMTLGLTEAQAEEQIVNGFLK
jgi:Fe-S cluster assembly scaffold protein SufB